MNVEASDCNDDESPYLSESCKSFINKIHSIGVVVIFIGGFYLILGIAGIVDYFRLLEELGNITYCNSSFAEQCFTPVIPYGTLIIGSFILVAGIAVMIFNKQLLVLLTERTPEQET